MTTEDDTAEKFPRLERLEARIGKSQKAFLVRAATMQGRSLTDFLIASVQEAAEKVLREHDVLTLSERDRKRFVATLVKPAASGKALRQAVKQYTKRTGI